MATDRFLQAKYHCPYCDEYGVAVGLNDMKTQTQVDAIALDNLLKAHHGMFEQIEAERE